MSIQNSDLKKRIIQISHINSAAHISSCLTAVDIIDDIYKEKKSEDKFILSSGHAALALYVVLEKYNYYHYKTRDTKEGYNLNKERYVDAEKLYKKHGVHPHIDYDNKIDCSTGSLGHGIGIAVGMAYARPHIDVHCLLSDGEMAEGSVWEALRIAEELKLKNLKLYFNFNGLSAMNRIDTERLVVRLGNYYKGDIRIYTTDCSYIPFLSGVRGHYKVLTDDEYIKSMEILS